MGTITLNAARGFVRGLIQVFDPDAPRADAERIQKEAAGALANAWKDTGEAIDRALKAERNKRSERRKP